MNKDLPSISILSLTCKEFVETAFQQLNKGRQHAKLLYEELFRTGQMSAKHPAFNNAGELYNQIIQAISLKTIPLIDAKNEGQCAKLLFRTEDHLEVETVLIPMQAGGTLCVSSQVGCRMGCSFCETGRMGLLRNLSVEEIVSQVFIARHVLGYSIRNIVFMGMGEPFDNFDNVMQAVRVLSDENGLAFGLRHITVSTSGLVDGIYKIADLGANGPNLAVSLTAATDESRNKLMPINKKHSLTHLYTAMKHFNTVTNRKILVAYVLLQEVNDSLKDCNNLAAFLVGLDVKVNLIPYNPQSRDRYQPPEENVIDQFAAQLRSLGIQTLLRRTKGRNIMAACGQLGNVELRKRLRELSQRSSANPFSIING